MATDPPAPDLGTIRANLEVFLGQLVTWREMETGWIRALLAAYDAQAAQLAAVEAERDQYRQRANSAEARMGNYRADNRRLSEARVRVQQRATRLAALEQAARAWAHDGSNYAESALLDAIEALDVPPGESP